jgi:GDP-4-dehydro-6-deoxy-D-mannose reductase
MRALITGITGFVGGHLAEHLLNAGDLVTGISSSGDWPVNLGHLASCIRLEACDLADAESDLPRLISRKKPQVIYHLAAQSNPQASLKDPRTTWALNLGGTLNLLEAVRSSGQHPRVVLVSSGVCYGNPDPSHLPVSESCPLRPNNPYAASKASADLLGVQHFLTYQTDTIIVRPFNHSGPRQSATYVLGGLAQQVAEVEANQRNQVEVGALEVVRDFTDVRDVAAAYRLLSEKGQSGEIYNLGTGIGTRIADALEILVALAARPVKVHSDPGRVRSVDQPLLVANSSKLRTTTGWEPQLLLEQTLGDMLSYSRSQVRARSVS